MSAPAGTPALSVVVPARDEAGTIGGTVRDLRRVPDLPREILVVVDDRADPTGSVVRRLERSSGSPVRLVLNERAPGIRGAILAGAAAARGEAVAVLMADRSDDPRLLGALARPVLAGEADLACASRNSRGGGRIGGPPWKGALSRVAGRGLHALLGLPTRDATNAYRVYRRGLLDELDVRSRRGHALHLEILVKAWLRGCRIVEVPTVWRGRREGRSKFRPWTWIPGYLRWALHGAVGALRGGRPSRRGTGRG